MCQHSSKPPRPPWAFLSHVLVLSRPCALMYLSLAFYFHVSSFKFSHQVPRSLPCCFSCLRALTQAWEPCAASPEGVVHPASPAAPGCFSGAPSSAYRENLRTRQELQHLQFIHPVGEHALSLAAEAACSWPSTPPSHH